MMSFCWKVLVPMGLALFLGVAIVLKLGLPSAITYALLFVVNVVILVATLKLLGNYTKDLSHNQNKRLFAPELPRL